MPAITKAKCLTDDCKGQAQYKGLCTTCYSEAKKLVESGKMTWERLEGLGLATAPLSKFKECLEKRMMEGSD